MSHSLTQAIRGIVAVGGTPVVRRLRLLGNLFDADKCFLLPQALEGLRKAVQYHSVRPFDQVVVVAHVAPGQREGLALERARMVTGLLTNQWKEWLPWFRPGRTEGRWGVREAQLILGHLGHYHGQAAGMMDTETRDALLEFKRKVNEEGLLQVPVTGHLDGPARQVLLWSYCREEGTALWKGMTPVALGSSHNRDPHPMRDGSEVDQERLEILLFERTYYPRPSGEVLSWEDHAYQEWMRHVVESDDLEFFSFTVQVVDERDAPLPGARVRLEGPDSAESTSDHHGWVSFRDLSRGTYRLVVWEGTERISSMDVRIPHWNLELGDDAL
ncbi:MAG TPA: carboxypeptidase-like regulatory domain-containing protein [Fibrobacteria bacterium]|nr:carboxypeptidase-like regulatory domain-containing protein [Fibrobacteria bacterium]